MWACGSIGIIAYLLVNAVMPITQAGEWRTIIDVIAVSTYLIGGIPMVLIALQDLGVTHKDASEENAQPTMRLMSRFVFITWQ